MNSLFNSISEFITTCGNDHFILECSFYSNYFGTLGQIYGRCTKEASLSNVIHIICTDLYNIPVENSLELSKPAVKQQSLVNSSISAALGLSNGFRVCLGFCRELSLTVQWKLHSRPKISSLVEAPFSLPMDHRAQVNSRFSFCLQGKERNGFSVISHSLEGQPMTEDRFSHADDTKKRTLGCRYRVMHRLLHNYRLYSQSHSQIYSQSGCCQ